MDFITIGHLNIGLKTVSRMKVMEKKYKFYSMADGDIQAYSQLLWIHNVLV